MFTVLFSVLALCLCNLIECKIAGKVVGGDTADIIDFPHSVFLYMSCRKMGLPAIGWICGASIVNQELLLTAAHCVHGCMPGSKAIASVGNAHINNGTRVVSESYTAHEEYNEWTVARDIALVKLKKKLNFTDGIKRVALMKNPPYSDKATVAGWGYINDKEQTADLLQYTDQYIWTTKKCKEKIPRLPKGVICAMGQNETMYSSNGDSGSALVIHDYIQIGLVSYTTENNKHLVVYTDTAYYYDWIETHAKLMYCSKEEEIDEIEETTEITTEFPPEDDLFENIP